MKSEAELPTKIVNNRKHLDDFEYEMTSVGFSVFSGIVPGDMLTRLRQDIPLRQNLCREWQRRNNLGAGMEGSAHHVVGGSDSLHDFLCAVFLDDYIRAWFGGEYIINGYGAINNTRQTDYQYGLRFHRDVRTYSATFRLMLNMLVMVDAFTIENGATKVIPGSQRIAERTSDEFFEQHAMRLCGSAGSIVLFDSNLWHSAAPNTTSLPRMALTLTFTRPFFKQQMDYPRMLGEAYPPNERVRQILGYNARVPCGYDEWYQPPEKRMYKPGQG